MGKKDQEPPRLVMGPLFEHVEDAQAAQDHLKVKDIDPQTVLTDEQLSAGGMRAFRGWVRTKKSNNALRQEKKRDQAEAEGKKQISITTRIEHHDWLKEISILSKDNEEEAFLGALRGWLDEQVESKPKSGPKLADKAGGLSRVESRILETYRAGGIRASVIRWIAK
jgi:hypothetical protein